MAGNGAYNVLSHQQHTPAVGYGPSGTHPDASKYLGPPTGQLQVNPYSNVRYGNYDYNETTKDTMLLVQNTLTGFITEDMDFYVTVVLPWMETSQTTIQWNEWHFNNPLADRVPYEGASRLITSSKEQFRAHVVRRGLAFVMEADYANTAEGREQWDQNVLSIAQAVQETQAADTMRALLESKTYQKIWTQRFGTERVSWRSILAEEIATFGSVNLPEGPARFEMLVEHHKRLMRTRNVVPDIIIMWPGAQIYMSMAVPERIEYWKAGPEGIRMRTEGPTSLGTFRQLQVFETRDFDVYSDSAPIQLLTRKIQIAEFYEMQFNRIDRACHDYSSQEMATGLYDENADEFRKITFLEAFDNTMIFDPNHGQYTREIADLVSTYNAEKRKSTMADESAAPTFFLTAPDGDGVWDVVRYFGMMELPHMTPMHVQRIGESIAGRLSGSVGFKAWADFMHLMHDLQSQGYNPTFWAALIAANTRMSVDANGVFVGESTPDKLAKHWGVAPQREWTPNEYGSLNLPTGDAMRSVGIPAGFANAEGFREMASHATKPSSPWHAIGVRARSALAMIENLLDTMKMVLPSSAAVDAESRAPWFHKSDALATFFDSVIGTSADPLFLAHLPIVQGVGGSDSEQKKPVKIAEDGSMPWFVLPGTIYDLPRGSVVTAASREALAEAIMRGGAPPASSVRAITTPGVVGGRVMIKFPSGPPVAISVAQFANVIQFTPELRALGLMPAGDSPEAVSARRGYLDTMASLDDEELRTKLADFVYLLGAADSKRLWNAMRGLRTVAADSLPSIINTIHLSMGASQEAIDAALRETDLLIASAGSEADFKDVSPLVEEWKALYTTPARAPTGSFGFASIAADAQRILNIERELLATADAAQVSLLIAARRAFEGGNALRPSAARAFSALTAGAGSDATRFNQIKAELTTLTARVDAVLQRQSGGDAGSASDAAAARARTLAGGETGGESVVVADNPAAVVSAAYYRAPLTATRAFLESLSSMFSGNVAKPLAIPGDPATSFVQEYGWHGDGGAAAATLPGSILRRPQFTPISAALSAAETSQSYATLSDLMGSETEHTLDGTPLVKRLTFATSAAVPHGDAGVDDAIEASIASAAGSGGGGAAFDDSDDEDIDSMSAAGIFNSSAMVGAPAHKRSRGSAGTMLMGSSAGGSRTHHNRGEMLEKRRTLMRLRTGTFAMRWTQTNTIPDPIVRIAARVFLMSRADNADTWRRMIESDIIIPMNILLWRMQIVHDMASSVMLKGGPSTGANYYGGANVAKGSDVSSKRVYYNFTFRSKAQVFNEKAVAILHNLKFEGYAGGHNTEFVKRKRDLDRTDRDRPSLIATAVAISEVNHDAHIDFSGYSRVRESSASIDGPRKAHYGSADYYNKLWKIADRATPMDRISRSDFFEAQNHTTTLASHGSQFTYDPFTRRLSQHHKPQGHLKLNMARPGGRDVMDGITRAFTEFDYSTVVIN